MYRADFPALAANPNLVYLDSAATTLKPARVIAAVQEVLSTSYAPVGRALYPLGISATERYEAARSTVHRFLGAGPESHTIFTASATDSLNTIAQGLSEQLREGDEILISTSEHHANFLPWQALARQTGATLVVAEIDRQGSIVPLLLEKISARTKIVSVSLVSNVLGTVLDAPSFSKKVREQGSEIALIFDASQAVAHLPLSVEALDCDALVFSSHKVYGPSGVGVLWGRSHFLEQLRPSRLGGGMVDRATNTMATWQPLPTRLEAGSPNLEGVIGLATALDYLSEIGMEQVKKHTAAMSRLLTEGVAGCTVLGHPDPRSGIVSVHHPRIHAHDLAQGLADLGVCVRAGHHCAQPLHTALDIPGSLRASVGLYTTEADCVRFAQRLQETIAHYG
jgi:cysteine desulfurase/selenocysteine lyase